MKKEEFTRKEVVLIIHQLLQMPDLLTDAFSNEHTDNGAEELLEISEEKLADPRFGSPRHPPICDE